MCPCTRVCVFFCLYSPSFQFSPVAWLPGWLTVCLPIFHAFAIWPSYDNCALVAALPGTSSFAHAVLIPNNMSSASGEYATSNIIKIGFEFEGCSCSEERARKSEGVDTVTYSQHGLKISQLRATALLVFFPFLDCTCIECISFTHSSKLCWVYRGF